MMYQNGLSGYNYGNYYPQQIPRQNYVDQQRTGMGMNVPTQPSQPTYYLKGRPVTSFKEVEASMVDFDGSVFYFPDPANQCIYTKRINEDGTPAYGVYRFQELPIGQPIIDDSNFITRQEFDNVIAQLRESLTMVQQPQQAISQKPQLTQKSETVLKSNSTNDTTSIGANETSHHQAPISNF